MIPIICSSLQLNEGSANEGRIHIVLLTNNIPRYKITDISLQVTQQWETKTQVIFFFIFYQRKILKPIPEKYKIKCLIENENNITYAIIKHVPFTNPAAYCALAACRGTEYI